MWVLHAQWDRIVRRVFAVVGIVLAVVAVIVFVMVLRAALMVEQCHRVDFVRLVVSALATMIAVQEFAQAAGEQSSNASTAVLYWRWLLLLFHSILLLSLIVQLFKSYVVRWRDEQR